MRILQIHKYHYYLGGAERYYLDLSELLREKGHEVANFSMADKSNSPSQWKKYFVSNVTFDNSDLKKNIKSVGRMFYSFEAKEKISRLLDEFKPDIAHVHSIYNHLSPSILPEIKKRGIPIVQTIHDYHLISPNVNLYHNGAICEKVNDGIHMAILHKCVKDSYTASLVTAGIFYIHKLFKFYEGNVDYFIAPSNFIRKKLITHGFDKRRIVHIPNFIYSKNSQRVISDNSYILYFGRLYEHKGLFVLLRVAESLPEVQFRIAGDGPKEKHLKIFVKKHGLKNVRFLGRLDSNKLNEVVSNSAFSIVPSLWYENMPYSILESFGCSKPVVASRIGGIQEIVKNGKNGLLFDPGNTVEFSRKVIMLWNNPGRVREMGRNARESVTKKYFPEIHYKKLMKIYKMAIEK